MISGRSLWGSGVPGGREVGCELAQTRVVDRVDEGARVRKDGAEGFRVVRDRCLSFLCARPRPCSGRKPCSALSFGDNGAGRYALKVPRSMDASRQTPKSCRPESPREFNELGPTLAGLALTLVATAGCGKPADETPAGQVERHVVTLNGDGWFTNTADRLAAARALGDLATEVGAAEVKVALGALFQSTRGPIEVAAVAEAAFCRTGSAGVSYLSESLRDTSPEVRLHALKLIDRWGKEAVQAVPAVIELINDRSRRPAHSDLSLAQGVVEKFGSGTPLEVRHLLDTRTSLGEVGPWAIALLEKWGVFEPGYLPTWRSAASDPSPAMRLHALEVLRLPGYGFQANRDLFINAMKDSDMTVAVAAACVVVREERTAPELVQLLSRYSWPKFERRSDQDRNIIRIIDEIAPALGLQAIPFLVSWMEGMDRVGARASVGVQNMEGEKGEVFAALVAETERTRPVFTRWHYECFKAIGGEALKDLPPYSKERYERYAREARQRIADLQKALNSNNTRAEAERLVLDRDVGSMTDHEYEAALKELVQKESLQKKIRELTEKGGASSSPDLPPGARAALLRSALHAASRLLR